MSPENENEESAVSYQNSQQVLNDSSNANDQKESDFNKNVDQQKTETPVANDLKKGKFNNKQHVRL